MFSSTQGKMDENICMGYADLFTGMSEKQMENFNKLYEKVMGEMIDTSINRIKEWMNKKTENNEEYPIFALNDVVYILPDNFFI
jgi:hypothetical protein